ncbi:MAG: hypothetical protein KDK51_09515, partial [Deltaproteobacteria bacterium]|nr:hypothetical protein [Deltaproteobacteria bacterium]
MQRFIFVILVNTILQSCATVSVMRPAHHLEKGQLEASAGVAVNPANVLFAAKLDYGITNKIEVGLQYETLSFVAGGRYQIFANPEGFALSLGLQTGSVVSIDDDQDGSIWVWAPNITLGWQRKTWNIYLGYKAMLDLDTYQIGSVKLGVRKQLSPRWFIGIEGGSSHYNLF